jgi:hypothetical protein
MSHGALFSLRANDGSAAGVCYLSSKSAAASLADLDTCRLSTRTVEMIVGSFTSLYAPCEPSDMFAVWMIYGELVICKSRGTRLSDSASGHSVLSCSAIGIQWHPHANGGAAAAAMQLPMYH